MMKILLIAILLVAVINYSNAISYEIIFQTLDEKINKECMTSTGITQEDFKKLVPNEEPCEEMLCYMKCILEKTSIIDDNGVFQEDKMTTTALSPSMTEKEIETYLECLKKTTPVKECKDVRQYHNCIKPNLMKN